MCRDEVDESCLARVVDIGPVQVIPGDATVLEGSPTQANLPALHAVNTEVEQIDAGRYVSRGEWDVLCVGARVDEHTRVVAGRRFVSPSGGDDSVIAGGEWLAGGAGQRIGPVGRGLPRREPGITAAVVAVYTRPSVSVSVTRAAATGRSVRVSVTTPVSDGITAGSPGLTWAMPETRLAVKTVPFRWARST